MDKKALEKRLKQLEQENINLKKLDQKLRESEEKYRAAIEQSLENIVILDIESKKIIEANRAFRKFLGYNAKEIKNLTIYDFVAHSKKDINQKINKAIQKEKLYLGERKYRKKNGTIVTVEVSGNVISYGGKKVICIVSRDVTANIEAKEKLANEKNLLRTLIDNIPDAIWIKDIKGKFLIGNKATARDLGINSPDDLIGKTDFDFLPKDIAKEMYANEQKIIYSGKTQLHKEVPSKDGRRWGLNTKVPLRDNNNDIIDCIILHC